MLPESVTKNVLVTAQVNVTMRFASFKMPKQQRFGSMQQTMWNGWNKS